MNKEELKILSKVLSLANNYFTQWCEFTDTYICEQDEIDEITDETEKEEAQENKNYDELLKQALDIIEKYEKE